MKSGFRSQRTTAWTILSTDEIVEIHNAALEVLWRVGMKVQEDEALSLLSRAGCSVTDHDMVHVPEHLVAQALALTPKRIPIYSRRGELAMFLEGRESYYGLGSDQIHVRDLHTGERRLAVKQDVVDATVLSDALDHIDFVEGQAAPSDISPRMQDIHIFQALVSNTTKPLIPNPISRKSLEITYRMACAAAGGEEKLRLRPFIIVVNTPISPLVHNDEGLRRLLFCAEKHIPFIYSSGVTAGATAPVTGAGLLTMVLSEWLCGLVIAQLKSPGTPFMGGGGFTNMDLASCVMCYGSPEFPLWIGAFREIMLHYGGIPIYGTGGCSDAVVCDEQAALEAMMNLLMGTLNGGCLIHDVGTIANCSMASHELLVMCNDMAGMAKRIVRGIEVTRETLAVDVIEKVGPGGNFLMEDHTLRHMREEHWRPQLLHRGSYQNWLDKGGLTLSQRCNQRAKEILEKHRPEPLPAAAQAELSRLMEEAERTLP